MDESFPAKRFKSNKMINRGMSGSDATLHIWVCVRESPLRYTTGNENIIQTLANPNFKPNKEL